MAALRKEAAALPAVVAHLDSASASVAKATLGSAGRTVLDDLFSRYTMEREREVHRQYLMRFGIAPSVPAVMASEQADDGVLLF